MGGVVILDGEMVAKGVERFDFGLNEAVAVPEYLELGDFIFETAGRPIVCITITTG